MPEENKPNRLGGEKVPVVMPKTAKQENNSVLPKANVPNTKSTATRTPVQDSSKAIVSKVSAENKHVVPENNQNKTHTENKPSALKSGVGMAKSPTPNVLPNIPQESISSTAKTTMSHAKLVEATEGKLVISQTTRDKAMISENKDTVVKAAPQKKRVKKNSQSTSSNIGFRRDYRIKQSKVPFIIMACGLLLSSFFIFSYVMGENTRMLEQLQDFPTEVPKNFVVQSNPILREWIAKGEEIIPWIISNFENANTSQQVAMILVLGEIKSSQSSDFLLKVVEEKSESHVRLAMVSLAKLKDLAIPGLIEKVKASKSRRTYFLEALGNSQHANAMGTILEFCEDGDWQIREIAIKSLKYFGKEERAMDKLFKALLDQHPNVGNAVIATLSDLFLQQQLTKYANTFNTKLVELLQTTKDITMKSRIIQAMGIFGMCLKPDGDTYAGQLIPQVRDCFRDGTEAERIAASLVLGKFHDIEMLPELLASFDSETPEMTKNIALALQTLNVVEVPQKLLESSFRQYPHVQVALSQIYQSYHTYILRLGMEEQVILAFVQMWENGSEDSFPALAAGLGRFLHQPLEHFLWTKEDFKNISIFISRVQTPQDDLHKLFQFFDTSTKDVLAKTPKDATGMLVANWNRVLVQKNLEEKLGCANNLTEIKKLWGEIDVRNRIIWNRFVLQESYKRDFWPTVGFLPSDFQNFKGILEKILPTNKAGDKDSRSSLARALWNGLGPESQKELMAYDSKNPPPPFLIWRITEEWNRLVSAGPIYTPDIMPDVILSPYILSFSRQSKTLRSLVWYNRQVIHENLGANVIPQVESSFLEK